MTTDLQARIDNELSNVAHYLEKSAMKAGLMDESTSEVGALRWAMYHMLGALNILQKPQAPCQHPQIAFSTQGVDWCIECGALRNGPHSEWRLPLRSQR